MTPQSFVPDEDVLEFDSIEAAEREAAAAAAEIGRDPPAEPDLCDQLRRAIRDGMRTEAVLARAS